MNQDILKNLQGITTEEQAILDGRTTIDREIYMQGQDSVINAAKLLAAGKLITLRPSTRFIDFPEHTHDYVEVVYMCSGQTTHIVNGKKILLRQGDLLFLNQKATHAIQKADVGDVAVNLIILPEFFVTALTTIGEEETPLKRFLVDCLCNQNLGADYLHFSVSDAVPIQNLIENLLWVLLEDTPNKRKLSQMTMAVLFLQLMGHTETLITGDEDNDIVLQVLRYVETHYADGSLGELAEQLHYDVSWLSRQIKQKTGKTYTQLVQEKRLAQAAFLLKNTDRKVSDISFAVGYENVSFFHRVFASVYGKTPKQYRDGR